MHANHPKFKQEFNKLTSKYQVVPLGTLCESIFSGITPKAGGDAYTQDETGVLFIKSGCLSYDGTIIPDETSKIIPEVHNGIMKASKLKKDDVLIAIVGATIGKVGIYTSDREANINQAIAAVRLKKDLKILPEFLIAYLLSNIGQTYLEYLKRPVARANINLKEIASIGIPMLDLKEQERYANYFKFSKMQYRSKINQVDDFLNNINYYLLTRLNLSFDDALQPLCYAQKYMDISSRVDADFYSPRFTHFRKQIEDSVYPTVPIGEICKSISSGFAAGKQDQADDLLDSERVPQIRPFSITPYGQISFETKKYVPISRLQEKDYCKRGEVLFNNTNSAEWIGKSVVFDVDIPCAASNHITRITLKEGINPYYIAAFFNMLRSIGYWKLLSTYFNNQAGVNIETLKAVRILLPEKPIQDEIAKEILKCKNTAEVLRIEAERDWVAAKVEFERELLGE